MATGLATAVQFSQNGVLATPALPPHSHPPARCISAYAASLTTKSEPITSARATVPTLHVNQRRVPLRRPQARSAQPWEALRVMRGARPRRDAPAMFQPRASLGGGRGPIPSGFGRWPQRRASPPSTPTRYVTVPPGVRKPPPPPEAPCFAACWGERVAHSRFRCAGPQWNEDKALWQPALL